MIALTRIDKVLRDEPAQLIATVHDEAVLLVPDDLAALERIGAVAQNEMIAAFLEVFPDAPILGLVDPAVGPTWGDLVPLLQWLVEHREGHHRVGTCADIFGQETTPQDDGFALPEKVP